MIPHINADNKYTFLKKRGWTSRPSRIFHQFDLPRPVHFLDLELALQRRPSGWLLFQID
jgi:hypothetical protein